MIYFKWGFMMLSAAFRVAARVACAIAVALVDATYTVPAGEMKCSSLSECGLAAFHVVRLAVLACVPMFLASAAARRREIAANCRELPRPDYVNRQLAAAAARHKTAAARHQTYCTYKSMGCVGLWLAMLLYSATIVSGESWRVANGGNGAAAASAVHRQAAAAAQQEAERLSRALERYAKAREPAALEALIVRMREEKRDVRRLLDELGEARERMRIQLEVNRQMELAAAANARAADALGPVASAIRGIRPQTSVVEADAWGLTIHHLLIIFLMAWFGFVSERMITAGSIRPEQPHAPALAQPERQAAERPELLPPPMAQAMVRWLDENTVRGGPGVTIGTLTKPIAEHLNIQRNSCVRNSLVAWAKRSGVYASRRNCERIMVRLKNQAAG